MNSKLKLSMALIASLTLEACGGGGGSTNTASITPPPAVTPTTPTSPAYISANLQTSVPALTYAQNSQEYPFVSGLNAVRKSIGLGLLAQNVSLDKAASNHVKYVTANSISNGGTVDMAALNSTYGVPNFHIEDPVKAGFTGVRVGDRVKFAGYGSDAAGEAGSYGTGAESLATLIATVYHRQSVLDQSSIDIGVAVASDSFGTTVVDMGLTGLGQHNASDFIGSYPSDKQTLVPLFMSVEAPNPFSDIAATTQAAFSQATSYPVSIIVADSQSLSVTSFTITEDGQTTALPVRLLTSATDQRVLKNYAFVVGKAPFKPNTKYNVSFSGAISGNPVTKTWSFTTASACRGFSSCN